MIYKYTKCESVIAKIMADADMEESKLRITDIKEWIFEAVEKIGAPMQYVYKEMGTDSFPAMKIEGCQVPIPDDLHILSTVAYSKGPRGPWVPVKPNNSSFRERPSLHHDHHCHDDIYCHHHCLCDDTIIEKPITSLCQLYGINGMRYLERAIMNGEKEEPKFFVKPGWIVLNRKKGFVKLAYKAIATDERGYPLIPDMASYQEAIYWYVMMKLSFPKFLKGKLGSAKAPRAGAEIYTYIQQQWNFYRNQAYAEAMMPTESDMRSIKDEWNKLVPDYNSDEVFFRTEGEKQLNYTDYYYGY